MHILISVVEWVVPFLIMISVLILPHEGGHFIVAKLFRFRVTIFSLGFGSRVLGRRWGGTDYRLSAVPLGGYVLLPDMEINATDSRHSRFQKGLVAFAGPAANILLAIVLLAGLNMTERTVPAYLFQPPVVGVALPGDETAPRVGDRILSVNGRNVDTWQGVEIELALAQENGRALELNVKRGDGILALTQKDGAVTIAPADMTRTTKHRLSSSEAVRAAASTTWAYIALTGRSIAGMFTGMVSSKNLAGPVGMASAAKTSAREGGQSFLQLIALFSIGLAFFNLLPIPVLDGGMLFILLIESVLGRSLSLRVKENVLKAGFGLLMGIIVFALVNDVLRLVG